MFDIGYMILADCHLAVGGDTESVRGQLAVVEGARVTAGAGQLLAGHIHHHRGEARACHETEAGHMKISSVHPPSW